MNILEANAVANLCEFLAGRIDHCDESTRAQIARDIAFLQRAASAQVGGESATETAWDDRLCDIAFEGALA